MLLRLVDVLLCFHNIFNGFVLFAHLHPVESPIKKVAVKSVRDAVTPIHSVPYLTSAILSAIFITALLSGRHAYESGDTLMLVRAVVAIYTFACTSIFIKLSDNMIKLGIDRTLDIEREVSQQDIVRFVPPSPTLCNTLMAPMKPFIRVDSTGLERIPDNTPHLYVMNHSLLGVEMPFFLNTLYQEKGVFVRGLADHVHFATPNGPFLRAFGAVDGTRANVDILMKAKQDILVYPGGAHEVMKHSSVPRYDLLWKERLGFARLAIKNGYRIIPCAAVGTEDMLDTVMDVPVGFARKDLTVPIAVTSPNKIQKIYFWFGEPIPTDQYDGDCNNDDFAREVRDKAKATVSAGIKELLEKQRNDPDRYLMDQYAATLKRAYSKACESFYSEAADTPPTEGDMKAKTS